MERRRFLLVSLASALAVPRAAKAQRAEKVPRIGYLHPNITASPHLADAFRQGLHALGYVEGRNVLIEYRDAEGKFERLPALAAELVALRVDVIVTSGTLATLAAKHATSSIPIVFPTVGDPVTDGLVISLARPGGNVTGLSNLSTELVGKCLELLRQAMPAVSQVAILWQPNGFVERTRQAVRERAELAGRALGMRLVFVGARAPEDFERAFSDMTRARVGAVIAVQTAMFVQQRRRLVGLAEKFRVPAVYESKEHVDVGGLMSYGPNLAESFQRSATYVDKILKGAKPGDLPIEQPTTFELVINLKTAKALSLTIPPPLIARADQVIQ